MCPAPAANSAARTASACSRRHVDHPLVQRGPPDSGDPARPRPQRRARRPARRTRRGRRVGVGVRGEQRAPRPDQAVHQRALRRVGGDGVHPAQQQRVVGQQQPAVGHLVDHRGGRVDRDGHRVHHLARGRRTPGRPSPSCAPARGGYAASSTVDDVANAHAHRHDLLQSPATSVGHSGAHRGPQIAARQADKRVAAAHRNPLLPQALSHQLRIGHPNSTNGAAPSTTRQARSASARRPYRRAPAPTDPRLRAASATAAGALHAVIASSCSVPSGQCGRCAVSRASNLGGAQRVAHPQPGQRPGLGEAAQHQHVRQRLGRPATPARRAPHRRMPRRPPPDAPGAAQRQHSSRGCSTGGVGRVADHHQVGRVRDHRVGQTERRRAAPRGPPALRRRRAPPPAR